MNNEPHVYDEKNVNAVKVLLGALQMKPAIIVVDMQKDFADDGALPVKGTYDLVPTINEGLEQYAVMGLPVYFTRDWHPEQTFHFDQWPPHCIANTEGAEFVGGLKFPQESKIVSKGMDPSYNGYSGFDGIVDDAGISLVDHLHQEGVTDLVIVGVATDYCVKHTALDAVKNGFKTSVMLDGTAAVNLKPVDEALAVTEMLEAGINIQPRGSLSGTVRT